MSATLANAAVSTGPRGWWRSRALWVPLVIVLANAGVLLSWSSIVDHLIGNAPLWAWRLSIYEAFEGWTLAYAPLTAIWVSFAVDRAVVRYPCAAVAIATGTLMILCQWTGLWSFDFFRTYYLPMWPKLVLAAIYCVSLLHLVLYPLRQFLGWRLDFSPATMAHSSGRPFQFTLRDVTHLSVVTAVALAIVRASTDALVRYGKNDLYFEPSILRLMSFGQILIPTLACAWLILGRKRQWIGGLVLVLALGCPAVLYYAGWYIPLRLGMRELWWAHWMNVGAVACVVINLLALRLCGLRGAVVPAQARTLSATTCPTADTTAAIASATPAQ